MAAKGKKGKKKGTTMALTDFLSDEQGNIAGPGTSYVLANKPVDWATEMDELDTSPDSFGSPMMSSVNRAKLPTGPKASRGPEDLERVPTQPPFKAFIGNLPYEVTEQSIEDFFRNLAVKNVQLVLDNGRFKGFGYVEFETRQALIEALGMSEELLGGRKARIDLAEKHNDGGKGGRPHDDGPDRTEGDWRREGPPSGPPASRYDDKGGRGGFEDRRYDDRGPRGFDDRGPRRGFEDGGSRGFEDRGSRGFDDRGGSRGFEDRGPRGFDDRGGGSRGFGRRDDRGGDRYDDRGPSRGDRYDDRGPSRGFEDRDGGRRGYGSGFDRERDRGYGGDRDQDSSRGWERSGQSAVTARPRDDRSGGYDRQDRQDSREPEAPKERPRLQLQKRSKPVEPASGDAPTSSIFGSAKPVDTTQREREIEERMLKKKADPVEKKSTLESRGYGASRGYEEPPERRQEPSYEPKNVSRSDGGGARRRSDSDRSQDSDGRRERRSSGRGRKVSGGSGSRPLKDDYPAPSDAASPGDEPRDEKPAVSPVYRDEPPKNLVPAPPPKENIWEKRKTTVPASSAQGATESRATPPTSPSAAGAESYTGESRGAPEPKSPTQQSQAQSAPRPQSTSQGSEHQKKEFVPAEPPKENPWMKRRQEPAPTHPSRGETPESPADSTAPAGRGAPASVSPSGPPNAWAGRGASSRGRGGRGAGPGAGRGRGDQKPREKRERALPQSVDEMPRLENKSKKDFSDGNKFAGLIDDDDGDYEVES